MVKSFETAATISNGRTQKHAWTQEVGGSISAGFEWEFFGNGVNSNVEVTTNHAHTHGEDITSCTTRELAV